MKTIIFDFGNVIGFFDYRMTLERLAQFTDMTAEELYAAVYDSPLDDDYESGRMSTAEFLKHVRELCRLRCPDEVLAAAWADIFRPNAEVCALVPLLKPRFRLLLGSNTNELHARQFRRQFADTLQHFDGLVLSYEIGTRKPKAAFFQHCQRRAGCPASKCLFIDDMPANIAGAQACGLHGIRYTTGGDLSERLRALGILGDASSGPV